RGTSHSLPPTLRPFTGVAGWPAGTRCAGFCGRQPGSTETGEVHMRIAVIGSGLGGLSAACTLAARGYEVEVFEKNPWLGGKAAVLTEQGFRFDMGPTILIQPSVLRRIFCEAGRNMSDYLDMVRLDPQWRCFFDDGTVLDLKDDLREMAT